MKQVIKKITQSLLLVPVAVLGMSFVATPAYAVDPAPPVTTDCDTTSLTAQGGANCAKGDSTPSSIFGTGGIFTVIVNILLFVIGAIAVIMLIVGGIRYVVSGGDQAQVTAAKNTIMYAVVGIIIAILAYAIINFVLGIFARSSVS